ncbi:MAG TPA: hypothetical protein VE974_03965 [Thermoanaerobaculia bacterium]|nr:hypothetical protein [Thermoanaerobaculia bacterium]
MLPLKGTIDLPVVDSGMTLRQVLNTLNESHRSGAIVFDRDARPRLVRRPDILRAVRYDAGTLADVKSIEVSLPHENKQRQIVRAVEAAAHARPQEREKLFRRAGSEYAVVELTGETVVVAAKSNELTWLLGDQGERPEPLDCYCTGPRQHGYPSPPPKFCRRDGAAVECF